MFYASKPGPVKGGRVGSNAVGVYAWRMSPT